MAIHDPQTKIQAVEEAMFANTARVENAILEMETGKAKTADLNEIAVSAMQEVSINEQTVAQVSLNADLQEQNANIAVLEASGGTDAQVRRMTELTLQEEELDMLLGDRRDIMAHDRPWVPGFIDVELNKLQVQGVDQDIRSVSLERDQTKGEIANIHGAQVASAKTNSLTKQTLNDSAIAANLSNIAANNTIASSEKEIANIHSNANQLGQIVAMDNQQVANALSAAKFEQTQDQMAISKERLAFQRKEFAQRMKKMPLELEQLEATVATIQLNLATNTTMAPARRVAEEARLGEAVRRIDEANSLRRQQVEGIRAGQSAMLGFSESPEIIANGIRNNPAKYEELRQIGAHPKHQTASTPAGAIRVRALTDPNGEAKETKAIRLLNMIKLKQAAKYQQKGVTIPKTVEGLEAALNITAQEELANFASNIITGAGNPYAAPPMESLAPLLAGKGIALYDKVISQSGMVEVDPQAIINEGIAGHLAGRISLRELATGTVQIFKAAGLYNIRLEGGLSREGLPDQDSYNSAVKYPKDVYRLPLILTALPLAKPIEAALQGLELVKPNIKIIDFYDEVEVMDMYTLRLKESPPINPATPTSKANSPAPKGTTPEIEEAAKENQAGINPQSYYDSLRRS